jgi:hypothetical protein
MSNEKQQTAVEWLIDQLQLLELNKNRISAYAYESRIHYTISKAKEIHKQETINNKTMINNNQKTAVEWYDNQLRRVFSNTADTSTFTHEELLEQAKEIEKERELNAYANGQADTLLMFKQKISKMKDISTEFNQLISDNFWDLV